MTGAFFDRVLMVDWSSGNDTGPRPRKDAIWLGESTAQGDAAPLYLRNRVVAEALLGVTDRRIGDARQPIKGTYERLRGTAKTHVAGAVPGLARALGKFV